MHEVFAVTCVYACAVLLGPRVVVQLSCYLTGLLFPVSCPLFLGRRGRHLSLWSLVTTSQVATKAGSHEGSVAQLQSTT